MSSTALISMDTSEKRAVPIPNGAEVKSNTPDSHLSSTHSNGVQRPGSNNSSVPPPYTRNSPLDGPLREGDAPVVHFYSNGNGTQNGLQPATAPRMDPLPATSTTHFHPLTPMTAADADPFADDMVLDESLLRPPSLLTRASGLRRGLQIPSRVSIITWGFSLPEVLAEQGVTKSYWRRFKHELEDFARLSVLQWVTVLAYGQCVNLLLGPFPGLIPVSQYGQVLFDVVEFEPGIIVQLKMQKKREHENFILAYQGGAMKVFEDRWNNDYFHPLGLHIRIEPPGIGKMDGMDVASSKLFRYQQKMGTSSPAPGVASKQADKKEYKYQLREGRYRMKAARKGRIIVLPFSTVKPLPAHPRTTGPEIYNGQSEGITTRALPSVQDFASSNQTHSGPDDICGPRTTAQYLASSHQRQSNSEGLDHGRTEKEAERARSLARAPTTHWGGNG